MADATKFLELFQNTPPRLYPDTDRDMIQGFLNQLAADSQDAYAERLATYNAMCDKLNVPRFPQVIVTRQEIPAQAAVQQSDAAPVDAVPAEQDVATVDLKPKKKKKTKDAAPAEQDVAPASPSA